MLNSTTQTMNDATMGDNSSVYENADANLTFDDLDSESTPNESGSADPDDWGSEDDELEDKTIGSNDGKLGSEELKLLNDSDGEDIEEEKAPAKKEEKKEEVEDKQDETEESLEKEPTEEEKISDATETGKKLRIKIGDDHFSLDSGAKLKVKVDGVPEEVSVQDLINNYSGKTAWDKKFTEVGQEKKQIQLEKQQFAAKVQGLDAKLAPIFDIIKDPMKDPFEALELLVDMTGQDSYAFYKRSLEARLDELVNLSQMNESQQEAFFLKKQNDRLLKSNEKRSVQERELQESKQLRSHVDELRQAYGVSVDQYSEAFDELKQLLHGKDFTHKDVVDYASIKPLAPKIEEILKPYKEEINDSDYHGIVTSLTRSLRDRKLSEEQIKKIVKDEFGVPVEVKALNTKLNIGKNKTPPKKIEEKPSGSLETFEDFDW